MYPVGCYGLMGSRCLDYMRLVRSRASAAAACTATVRWKEHSWADVYSQAAQRVERQRQMWSNRMI